MFSYRHAFHAGNHADVLKHTTLIALLQYLTQKDEALMVIDTHAGAGLYRLDGDYSQTSGEALAGVGKLAACRTYGAESKNEPQRGQFLPDSQAHSTAMGQEAGEKWTAAAHVSPASHKSDRLPGANTLAPALQAYLEVLHCFNSQKTNINIYPGSPFIAQRFLKGRDKLKLFELHPSDYKLLSDHIAQLEVGRQVALTCADGFEQLKTLLPPPSRRGLVLCDPSYEIKTDYGRVATCIADALKRFSTGTYAVWYPIIARPEAHDLPRKLKTLATQAGRNWLQATLTVKSSKSVLDEDGNSKRAGLPASGMFVINPPHTLKATLQPALAQLATLLAQDQHAGFTLTSG